MKPVAHAGSSVNSPPSNRVDVPTLIAHRGFAGAYPENTRVAMDRATTALGANPTERATTTPPEVEADVVEIDVVPCATGELVVFHDAYLDRLTDATGDLAKRTIWETPFDRLRELEVLGAGETVPLLSELMDVIPPEVTVNVELKNPGTAPARTYRDLSRAQRVSYDRAWERVAERFVDVASEFGHDLLVTSSFEGALRAIREYAPEVPRSYFFWDSIDVGMEISRRYDCAVVCPPRTAISGTSFFNDAYDDLPAGGFAERDLVSLAHAEGRAVYAWTVETERQASELAAAGIDGLLCDYPGVLGADATGSSSIGDSADD